MPRIIAAMLGSAAAAAGAVYFTQGRASADDSELKLLSCRDKFLAFASQGAKGTKAMTFNDFILSLCRGNLSDDPAKKAELVDKANDAMSAELKKLFTLFDADGDQQLSYEEYCVLFTILSTPAATFDVALRMFDANSTGTVDASQFEQMLQAMSADTTVRLACDKSGLVTHLFGEKRDRELTFDQFREVTRRLRHGILSTEYNLADADRTGRLTIGQMRRLLLQKQGPEPANASASSATAEGATGKKQRRRRRSASRSPADAPDNVATKEDYLAIVSTLHAAPQWQHALEIYQGAQPEELQDGAIDRAAFGRALRAADVEVTPRQVNLMFAIFDGDDSGFLDPDELMQVAAARSSFFAKHRPNFNEPKRNGIQTFVRCMQQR